MKPVFRRVSALHELTIGNERVKCPEISFEKSLRGCPSTLFPFSETSCCLIAPFDSSQSRFFFF